MPMVMQFGKPDIFLRFACNSLWPVIANSKYSYEMANNRPEFTINIFLAKVKKTFTINK